MSEVQIFFKPLSNTVSSISTQFNSNSFLSLQGSFNFESLKMLFRPSFWEVCPNSEYTREYSLNFIRLLRVVITPSEKTTGSNRMNFSQVGVVSGLKGHVDPCMLIHDVTTWATWRKTWWSKMWKTNHPSWIKPERKVSCFHWKKIKGFISCSKIFVLFIPFQSLPDQKDLDTKKKYKRNKKGEGLVLVCQNLLRLIILSGSFWECTFV